MNKVTKRIFSMLPLALPAALYSAPAEKPNVLIILMDDMGYSDIGCFGGEIQTPNINRLATNGVKFAQMYNTAKCYPTRSCLLTGVYYQRTSQDFLPNTATMGEVLRPAGYNTWWSGKNHAIFNPVNRGFDHYYGLIGGAENHFNPGSTNSPGQPMPASSARIDGGLSWWNDLVETADFVPQTTNFYDTDAFTDRALQWLDASNGDGKPFFLYMAYMSPHWPLHAWPEDIAKYDGVYTNGYAAVRQARYDRQVAMGLIDPATAPLPPFDSTGLLVWENLSSADRQKETMRMQIHAAMVDRVDQNIGRLVSKLEAQGRLTNTLIIFFSDNGACDEIPTGTNVDANAPMGSVATYEAIGPTWAQVCNTPLRKWKTDSFEGGVCTPMVVSWPAGFSPRSGWNRDPVHMIDVMPTVLEITGATYPGESTQPNIPPMDGVSLLPAFAGNPILRNDPLFFEFGTGAAARDGKWKIVRLLDAGPWELYDMDTNRTEVATQNQAGAYPALVSLMDAKWRAWWKNCTGVALTGSNYNFYTLTASSGYGSGHYFTNGQQAAISANAPVTGKTFVRWTGATQYVASATASNTTVTMPASNIALTAIYTNLPGWYALTVNNGTGSGMCSNGLQAVIAASNAPAGMTFVSWIGDTQYVASVTSLNTTVTMPARDVSLTATYTILPGWYTLTVNNGSGSGLYTNGQQVVIATSNALLELVFDRWTGDTQYVDNVTSMDTLLTMPTNAITLTATYVSSGNYLSQDDFSSGSWSGGTGWSNGWTVVPTATYGTVVELNATGSITRTFSTPIPKATLSFDWDLDRITTSQSGIVQVYSNGTWYTVWSYNVKGGDDGSTPQLVTATANLSAYGSISQIRFKLNGIETFHRFWIDNIRVSSTSAVPAYVLTVNSGSGDGSYTNGRQVAIQAYPMPGKTFYRWTGATQYVASITSANSTVTMPASNVSVTATYADAYYALTVNNGTGDGSYTNGEQVAILANTPAAGKAFDKWTGDTQYVDNASSLNTTVTMPAHAVSLTATYADVNYSLTINYGTGGGLSYTNEQRVAILANTPAAGKAFDKWTGDTQYLDNASSASTWMTMPARDVVLTATYVDVYYTLTVNSGIGDGSYTNGAQVEISADAPAEGQAFDHWTGDTQYAANSNSASTTVTMPAQAISLTATYRDVAVYHTLTANGGIGGAVSPASTNVLAGNSADFVITASNYYRIATLTTNGTAVTGMSFDNGSTTTNFIWSNVQTSGVLAATFTAQVVTNSANTPHEWLAGYGLTNSGATFDQAAVVDQDGDGLTAWQEYIAGTDPTNTTSGLKAVQNNRNIIGWSPVSGRVYSVYWATNLLNGFQCLESNILYPQGSYTNLNPGPRVNLYQIKVQMQ